MPDAWFAISRGLAHLSATKNVSFLAYDSCCVLARKSIFSCLLLKKRLTCLTRSFGKLPTVVS